MSFLDTSRYYCQYCEQYGFSACKEFGFAYPQGSIHFQFGTAGLLASQEGLLLMALVNMQDILYYFLLSLWVAYNNTKQKLISVKFLYGRH
jgi:hypothetical protein